MNLDVINDLFFISIGRNELWPSKLDCEKWEDPLSWLVKEVKQRSPKIVENGLIIGEAASFNQDTGKVTINYYKNPVPIMTNADWEELARIKG